MSVEVDHSGIGVIEKESGEWWVPFDDGQAVTVLVGEADGELQRFTTKLNGVALPAVVDVAHGELSARVIQAAKSRIVSGR
ncbi:hypothetical protein [Nocardia nova]|uniref:hypothetical protein n=1 Tax=Nocardia nova TaxID=37330 RepID=UPI00273A1D88|nr:hypothetical protein [Nocardia nova]